MTVMNNDQWVKPLSIQESLTGLFFAIKVFIGIYFERFLVLPLSVFSHLVS